MLSQNSNMHTTSGIVAYFLLPFRVTRDKADSLLSGTFHEIRDRIAFIEIEKMQELYTKKKAYRELEEDVGIL